MVSVNFLRNIWGVLLGGYIVAVLVDFTAATHPSTFHSSLTLRLLVAVVFELPAFASPLLHGAKGPHSCRCAAAGGVAPGSSDGNHIHSEASLQHPS